MREAASGRQTDSFGPDFALLSSILIQIAPHLKLPCVRLSYRKKLCVSDRLLIVFSMFQKLFEFQRNVAKFIGLALTSPRFNAINLAIFCPTNFIY